MRTARPRVCLLIATLAVTSLASAQDPNPRWMRSGHISEPTSIVFTADSRWLLTGGTDRLIRVWNARTGLLHRTIHIGATITSLCTSRDGAALVATDVLGRIHLLDPLAGVVLRWLRPATARPNSARLSADGRYAVVAYNDGIARLIDLTTDEVVEQYIGHSAQVTGADISADATLVVTSSDDFTTRVWRARPAELLHTIQEVQYSSNAVALSPDASTLVAIAFHPSGTLNSKRGISEFSTSTGARLRQLTGAFIEPLTGLTYSRDGRFVAITAHDYTKPNTINGLSLMVMDLIGDLSWGWKGANDIGWSNGAAFAPDGSAIAWTAAFGSVFLRRITAGPSGPGFGDIMTISDHVQPVRALALSRDDSIVRAGDDSGMVRVWRSGTGDRVASLRAHTMSVRAIDESPDRGAYLTASVDGTVKLWRADSLLQRVLYLSSEYPVTSARFVTGDRIVAGIGGFDSTAVLLDTASSRPLLRYRGAAGAINAVDVAPSNDRIVTASHDGRARVHDVNSATPGMTTGPFASPMTAVVFDATGELIFCGHVDGTVRMIDAASGFELYSLRAHAATVTGLSRTHDGALASSSLDSSVAVWTIGAESLIPLRRYREHPGAIGGLACGYRSPVLAAGALDATVIVYDASAPAAVPNSPSRSARLSLVARTSSTGLTVHVSGAGDGPAVVTAHDVLGRELARATAAPSGAPLSFPLNHSGLIVVRATCGEQTATVLCR